MCESSKVHPLLKSYKYLSEKVQKPFSDYTQNDEWISQHASVFQDKEAYRWPIRESLKTMVSWGWSIERMRESDASTLHNRTRRISLSSQVRNSRINHRMSE